MPSNSEMFERGAYDAEHDELNAFYYQHYYFYRRGYDQARRRVRGKPDPRMFVGAGALVLVALLSLGGWALFGWLNASQAAQTVTPVLVTTQPAPATPRPSPSPTPIPEPLAEPSLEPDTQALIVNLNGAPLRVRRNPGLTAEIGRINEGSEVTLREGPLEADGYMWWRIETPGISGWVAEGSPDGTPFLEPLP